VLSAANLLTVLDSVAKGVSLFEAAEGVLGSEANTVGKGAANNLATLTALNDAAVQADLVSTFQARATLVLAGSLYRGLRGASLQRALDQHYGSAGGSLNAFLTTQGTRVHPNLRKIGMQIDATNAFTPTEVDLVASFAVSGSGAGTYTPGTSVETTLYGKANLVVRTTTGIGVAAIAATVTLRKMDGTTEAKVVNIPGGTLIGVDVAIGVAGTDMYIGVTNITITGGTNGDGFKVVALVERAIAL
jgi:hypothetical protein